MNEILNKNKQINELFIIYLPVPRKMRLVQKYGGNCEMVCCDNHMVNTTIEYFFNQSIT